MSTISIATGITASPAPRFTSASSSQTSPRTRLRITARGRRVLTFLASLPLIAVIAVAVLSGGSAIASHEAGAPAGTFTNISVMPGDSLWSIATTVAPEADPRDVVAEISRLNNLHTDALSAGQTLAIPSSYFDAE
ncbi:LysM peptidoglycan-binding domain-containing protein [Microbacterium sp. ZW T5_56]|uniref:LysM peptidoglycan-binding domain-containing protein n=1 Tax=Microbacterium sp. ZW T5_56 TaxID=3378081 RepID=UPI0038523948